MSITAIESKSKDVAVKTPVQKYWTEDEVSMREIFAYEKGKNYMKKQIAKKADSNLNKAKNIAESIIVALHNAKVDCKGIHLRQTTVDNFTSIFIVPPKDFLSVERYNNIYNIANDIVSPQINSAFHFECMFMPFSKKINEDAILADGFRWTFGEKITSGK